MMNKAGIDALHTYHGDWIVFANDRVLVSNSTGTLPQGGWQALPFLAHYADQVHVLPALDYGEGKQRSLAVLDVGAESIHADGWQWVSLRHLLMHNSQEVFQEFARAWQYVHFLRTHRYCGQCGSPTEQVGWEMAVQCSRCQHRAYPRVSPCIIVAIYHNDELLLARGVRHKDTEMYSTLAGFVESGETLEQAVHREVMEEVGVKVKNLRYFDSQPWPFPHSLMVGFLAEYAGGDIVVDDHEIVDAYWFKTTALPKTPPVESIAGRLIEAVIQRLHENDK
ncbi:NAD(+) diphosphatase [Salinimonas sediminis]|uniref:NAD-capped RNA hydrolase NudC n=1 Tax=Salinimonas sediminis TaxID=2303538 RepID=A0A346NR65_9ALTE|nr:NAD(+) diphosphatase [Salinimonas sediminis]AXR08022.1 NAD(+) diphosphatase [Salinimonas sediminis]